MSFTLSGSTITQTGTDTDLSGLSGLAGVTVTVEGGYTVYDIGINRLVVDGFLNVSKSVSEQLVITSDVTNNNVKLTVNGTLIAGDDTLNISTDFYKYNDFIPVIKTLGSRADSPTSLAQNDGTTNVLGRCPGLRVTSTGNFEAYGCTLYFYTGMGSFVGGTAKFYNCFIGTNDFRFYDEATEISNVVLSGGLNYFISYNLVSNLKYQGDVYLNISSTTVSGVDAVVSGIPDGDYQMADNGATTDPTYRIRDAFKGSNYESSGGSLTTRQYLLIYEKSVNVRLSDENGDPVTGATVYIVGSDFAESVIATTDINGDTGTFIVELGRTDNPNGTLTIVESRKCISGYVSNNTADDFIVKAINYNNTIVNSSEVLKGNGVVDFFYPSVIDGLITESNRAIVQAYPITTSLTGSTLTITGDSTTLQTLTSAQLYDACKDYLVTNYAGETETIVSRVGNDLDCRDLDVVLDYITYTGNITTTGVVTLTNGSTVTGITTDSTGTTDLVIVENLVGSYIGLDDNTGAGVDYQAAVTGTYSYVIPAGSTGTWMVCLRKQGYAPRKITFPINGTIHTLDGTLIKRVNFDGTDAYTGTTDSLVTVHLDDPTTSQARIDIGNGQVSAQIAYNMAEDALVGMNGVCTDIDQVFQIDPLGFQLYSLSSNVELRRRLVTDITSGLQGIVSHEDGTPVDETNGGVRIYSAPIFLTQQDIRDSMALDMTVGTTVEADSIDAKADAILADTHELQTNQGAWATATGFATLSQGTAIQAKTDQFAFTGGFVHSDIKAISANTTASSNLNLQYNGTGLTGLSYPSTQAQIANIAVAGSAVNTVPTAFVLTTGTVTSGDYTATHALDGTRHVIGDVGGAMDFYYEFNVGSDGVTTGFKSVGALTGNNDVIGIYAYNWITSSWNQIGTRTGTSSTSNTTQPYDLLTSHVGTGANVGKVRIRYYQPSGLSTATLYLDQIIVAYTLAPSGISNGSTVTLNSAVGNTNLIGNNWKLILNGQDISGAYIHGAVEVSGTAIAQNDNGYWFEHCDFQDVILSAKGKFDWCVLSSPDTIHLTSTSGIIDDELNFVDCVSGVAGTNVPSIDASSVTKTTSISFRRWSGGLKATLNSFVTMSVDVVSGGNIKVYGTGGTIAVRGTCTIQDFSDGLVTIIDTSVINRDTISDSAKNILTTGMAQGGGNGDSQIQLESTASSVSGTYDPAMIYISEGTGIGQCRMILDYDGSTKIATVDRDWRIIPDATSKYIIEASSNLISINEGLLRGATTNTAILNTSANSSDGCYVGQSLWLRGGSGEDQVGLIIAYNGTTKVVTLADDWGVIPDTTTAYMVLPNGPVLLGATTHTGAIVPRVSLVDVTTENSDMITGFATEDNATVNKQTIINRGDIAWTTSTAVADLTPVLNAITAQTVDIKGVSDKDLTQVFDNTPDVNLTPVLDAIGDLNNFDPANDVVATVTNLTNAPESVTPTQIWSFAGRSLDSDVNINTASKSSIVDDIKGTGARDLTDVYDNTQANLVTDIHDAVLGSQKTELDQYTMYRNNGSVLKVFNLFDGNNNPTTGGAFKREGV